MALKIIPLLLFVSTVAAYSDYEVTYLSVQDANLIETQQGFAINPPISSESDIITVSVNGDEALVMRQDCKPIKLTANQLAASYGELVPKAKMHLNLAYQPQKLSSMYPKPVRSVVARYSLHRGGCNVNSPNGGIGNYNFGNTSATKFDDQNMSVKRPDFPDNINRIFFTNYVVTVVYNDGRVQMKPRNCLSETEQKSVQKLQSEVKQAEIQFEEEMRQFEKDMQPGGAYFGNDWPFGPNNNPFYEGFPF